MTDKQIKATEQDDSTDYLDFHEIFAEANSKFSRRSPGVEDLKHNFVDVFIQSAIAKCLDFNITANDALNKTRTSFFLIGNTRAICEDLIYTSFLSSIEKSQANKFASLFMYRSNLNSVYAQTRFFAQNNPLQPSFGSLIPLAQQETNIRGVKTDLKQLWRQHGVTSPTVENISKKMGLETTYGYIYHMTSNFVHFNPSILLRLGWGNEPVGPFNFSVNHFTHYYSSVSRFLGAILFYGYCSRFPDKFTDKFSEEYIKFITSRLESNVRWPEIVTFEEMNMEMPNILQTALMSTIRDENTTTLPNILSELKSLRSK
ncbi:MAG: DUF5677 domain-containing protein [Gammaproteobacteria bacterium]|nr:DUF5677 domain-containing protein [Gammaproteobacteria bacterium]